MKRDPLTFPTWIRLAFQLLLAFFAASLVAAWFDGPAGLLLGAAAGMALTLNLLRTWWMVGEALELRDGLPAWVDERWHGPLGPVVAGLNTLAAEPA